MFTMVVSLETIQRQPAPARGSRHQYFRPAWDRLTALGFIASGFLMFALATLYVGSLHLFQVGDFVDDAYYVISAQSLAIGKGYVVGSILGSPPMLRFPPGYPMVLSLVARIFPDSLTVFRLPSVIFTLAAVPFWLSVLRRRLAWGPALLVLAAAMTNVHVVVLATNVMSEALTLFLIPILILLIESLPFSEHFDRRLMIVRVVAIVAVLVALHLTRTIMIAFLVPAFLFFVLKRQLRLAFSIAVLVSFPFVLWLGYTVIGNQALAPQAVAVPWFTHQFTPPAGSTEFTSAYGPDLVGTKEKSTRTSLGKAVSSAVGRSWMNASVYFPDSMSVNLVDVGQAGPLSHLLQKPRITWLPELVSSGTTWLALLGLVGALAAVVSSRTPFQSRFAEFAVLTYFACLLLWPYPASRFFEPIIPIAYLALFFGIVDVTRLLPTCRSIHSRTSGAVLVIALLSLLNLRNDVRLLQVPPRRDIPDLSAGAAWINQNAPLDAIVVTDAPALRSLYVHRQLTEPPSIHDDDPSYLSEINRERASYAVVALSLIKPRSSPTYDPSIAKLLSIIAAYPNRFKLVFAEPDNHVQVYQIFGTGTGR